MSLSASGSPVLTPEEAVSRIKNANEVAVEALGGLDKAAKSKAMAAIDDAASVVTDIIIPGQFYGQDTIDLVASHLEKAALALETEAPGFTEVGKIALAQAMYVIVDTALPFTKGSDVRNAAGQQTGGFPNLLSALAEGVLRSIGSVRDTKGMLPKPTVVARPTPTPPPAPAPAPESAPAPEKAEGGPPAGEPAPAPAPEAHAEGTEQKKTEEKPS